MLACYGLEPKDPIGLSSHARGRVEAAKAQRCQLRPARSEGDLEQLEAAYRVLDLYIWLSFRLEDAFTGVRDASTL